MNDIAACSECGKACEPDEIVRYYDCGKPYCINCVGKDWIGVCSDCEEVFATEEDYWDWK